LQWAVGGKHVGYPAGDIAARVCMEGVVDFYFIGAVGVNIHLPVELAMRTMPSFTGTMPVTEARQ